MNNRYSWEDALLGTAIGLMALVVVIAVVLAAWFAVQIAALLVRVFAHHPHNRALWWSLGVVGASLLLVAVSAGAPAFVTLSAIASVGFLLVAKAVDLYYDDQFQREPSRELLLHDVLHEPWWKAA